MERKLAAILCADVYGYSRLMGDDEEATLRTLSSHRNLIDNLIEQHHGRFVNSAGDSLLAEFASVVNAVQCAVDLQSALKSENANLPSNRRMEFRIGVNLGDVMVEGEQIYGDGVNVAARLENLAEPGGICISGTVHDQIRDKLAFGYEDRGEQTVKNIVRPVHVWRVRFVSPTSQPGPVPPPIRRNYWRGGVFSLAGLAIIVVTIVLVQHVSLKPPHTNASIPPTQSQLPLPDKPSIAVLPFVNMSGDRDQEYFSDGITDDLITDLSRLPGLFVIARQSTFTYKDKAIKLQDLGRELGVKYVLGGSVRKAAGQIRITVQLADATTGDELWAESYDRPLRDVFALQDEIVRRIVTTLNLQLALSQRGFLIPRSTGNLDAYDDLLRGTEDLVAVTKDSNVRARPLFEKAIQLDPYYAMAHALLGLNYYLGWILAFDSEPNDLERALQIEREAVALDESLAVAHGTLADIYVFKGEYDHALTEAQRAIALDPNSAASYSSLADVLNNESKPSEALVAVDRAMRLDPRNSDNYLWNQGMAYFELGNRKEAIPIIKRYLKRYPAFLWGHAFLADSYSLQGDDRGAREETAQIEQAIALSPNSAIGYWALAQVLDTQGRPAEALVAVDKAIRIDPRTDLFPVEQGRAYTMLGRWKEAITALKRFMARYPDNFWAHAWLAVDYAEFGQDDAARIEAADVVRLNPEFTAETLFPTVGLEQRALPAETDRFRADLHKAGMN